MSAATPAGRGRRLYALTATALVVGLVAQMFLAGLAIFYDGWLWPGHEWLGFLLGYLVMPLAIAPWLARPLASLRRPATLVALAYAVQVVLGITSKLQAIGLVQALHVGTAALVLAAALDLRLRQPALA